LSRLFFFSVFFLSISLLSLVLEPGKKFFKRSELIKKQNNMYHERYAENNYRNPSKTVIQPTEGPSKEVEEERVIVDESDDMSRTEVVRRLRSRSQPITLFGETEKESRARLRRLEIEQPDMKEGWKNDLISAMKEVDHELVEEVVKGQVDDAGKHDVDMPDDEDLSWERIEENACLLGVDDNPNRDCDILNQFFSYILKRWGRALNSRDELTKRSPEGKAAATKHKQTMEHLRPLQNMLQKHTVNADIREHLIKICRLIVIDRDYIKANNAYMEMAIGNAPWPVGVTRSGLHQRPGSAKAYVSNIAHVLNDETQRKYIQAFKRLMTLCQKYFPTDPSKCVEYVKGNDASV
uniref:Pre-mRNA-splicing factor 18 n=1 Tax=Enterobius vermicularis TaxID=51028 RepID=A0A0N4VPI3_ENTVE